MSWLCDRRAAYCVKEVSNMESDTCGDSEYFGDLYIHSKGECQFKKCSADCVEETIQFTYNYLQFTRTRYCCSSDLCNSAMRSTQVSMIAMIAVPVVAVLLYLL
jgi:hypothetical protein